MIIEGKSSRYISDWLKERGENISHTALNNYRKTDYNVKEEAVQKYNEKKSKQRKNEAVDNTVSDLEALDEIILTGNQLKLELDKIRPDMETGVTDLDIEKVKIKAKQLVIQAARAKHMITRDEPPVNVNINFDQNPLLQDPDYITAKRRAMDDLYAKKHKK